MLRDNRLRISEPTIHPSISNIILFILDSEELVIGQIKFRTFDLGGHETGIINFMFIKLQQENYGENTMLKQVVLFSLQMQQKEKDSQKQRKN